MYVLDVNINPNFTTNLKPEKKQRAQKRKEWKYFPANFVQIYSFLFQTSKLKKLFLVLSLPLKINTQTKH